LETTAKFKAELTTKAYYPDESIIFEEGLARVLSC